MKVTTSTVSDILAPLRLYFQGNMVVRNNKNEEPYRSELYSSDQMNRHGKVVARSHKLLGHKSADLLLKRLGENEKTLLEVRNLLAESIRSGKSITPAGEWLLDNFYLIEEQVVIARKHLPKGYSEALPCLAEGISAGFPRVYDIVLEIISHSDGRVDVKGLSSFVASYQSIVTLTLGELWAIPIMLRLAVIENLRRVSGKIALDMIDNNLADYWGGRMLTTVKEEPGNLILTVADMARSKPILDSPFVAGFIRQLKGKGPALALPLNWVEQQLSGMGTTSNELVRQETQKQAADQVSVRNSIGTLRFIGATDWREFVETLSSVEQVLRKDTTGTYPLMDFATRDSYRHVVESISKASELSETEVAELALELARKQITERQKPGRQAHIGYYLTDKGLKQTEQAAGVTYTLKRKLVQKAGNIPVFLYLSSIALLSFSVAAIMSYLAWRYGPHNQLLFTLIALLSLSGASQLAVSLVNWLVTICVKPKMLPRMDFSAGIPPECRTLVIVPTMLSGPDYIEDLVEGLEIRFLANKEPNLHFGLLTDFLDADSETMPADEALLALARDRIVALNDKYSPPEEDIFFLFHRPRRWNSGERKWMGYERKRGKLTALNAFLRGKEKNEFSSIIGDRRILVQVKYVITLDSDTQLPRESAKKFIATMAHPLNQAEYDPLKKRVTEGYGILQPRVASAIPETTSPYLRMQGNVSGIDPYTLASSDVYQDLFREGSFIGKGIYDVDIFEQALKGVFQENRILSHDLLEGCYTRSGLLSDVFLYEDNPTQYEADIKRRHRWIRGDWQIGAWMLPLITGGNRRLRNNKLSALSRWKIFDNLRRSLLNLSLSLLLLFGWLASSLPWFWTLSVTMIVLLPVMTAAGWQLLHKPPELSFRAHLLEVGSSVKDVIVRFLFGIAVLPYEAMVFTDAVFRTNWRMIVTRKKLLEWAPSAFSGKGSKSLLQTYKTMWLAPLLALAIFSLLLFKDQEALFVAAPILSLWLFAPALAWRMSKPDTEADTSLTDEQTLFLHRSARKTWAFFEQFVTAGDNWLPPDNFQEQPVAVTAHRTSPTNMGLTLLANISAYDFGYIASGELAERCNDTLETMLKLDRYKGHFYNWYDTVSLLPLKPRYVSSVDSGNLCGFLLTLRQGLLDLPYHPIFRPAARDGLRTTTRIVRELAGGELAETAERILKILEVPENDETSLSAAKKQLDELGVLAEVLAAGQTVSGGELCNWTGRLSRQIMNLQEELRQLAPWTELLDFPAHFAYWNESDKIPSLQSLVELPSLLMQLTPAADPESAEEQSWEKLQQLVSSASAHAAERLLLIAKLAEQCELLSNPEYDFLFDRATSLLRIGYNVDEQRKDNSYYDLLASEARLGIFVGIAQGKLPQESWFALGRLLTNSGGDPILLSWSGSMFEYLMPQLVMPVYENTLLHRTSRATVKRQIEYAEQRGVPWGISESGYNVVDAGLNYQYRAFGVPGLGLKRGLEEDLVIAPYASMLALMVLPGKACKNLQRLSSEGFEGEFGFYEAIDYTANRLSRGKTHSTIQSYMVHHQGMGFVSLAYVLLNKPMQQRFTAELRFQATLLLLQERVPRATIFYAHTADLLEARTESADVQIRRINTPDTATPEVQLLSNGRYQVMVSNSGGGYSRWKNIAITRWREDATKDERGVFAYIKDIDTGKFWSNTYQPTQHSVKGYEALFSQGHVEFRRQDYGIDTVTEIVISPEDDMEIRRIRLTNRTPTVKTLEVTSYAEIVMAAQASDEAHPAFSNLFVQTEIAAGPKAVLCTRRSRSVEEMPPWMFHMMDVRGTVIEAVSYETDRMKFTGRGKTLAQPQAMTDEALSGSQGAVLDPIVSIRSRIRIKPGQTVTIDLIYGITETREACEALLHKCLDQHLKNRAFELSWTHSQVLLRQINATEADVQLYDRLAASVIYANPALRAEPAVIQSNSRGQSGLWSHSVSGDLPIVLLHVSDHENVELVKQLIQAHAYWQWKGLAVDLVIWNENHGSYRQLLQEHILGMVATEAGSGMPNGKPGSIFVKSADQLSPEDRILFESVARVIIYDNKGTLSEQVTRHNAERVLPALQETTPVEVEELETVSLPSRLLFFNGTGGFTRDGKKYKIITGRGKTTPAPWVNVLANPFFGTVISESGSAYTWAVNAHEYRITPWNNDPVSDTGGEAFYVRNERTGHFWSPSPFPATGTTPYITTHGFGYTVFEHSEQGISSEMCVFVDRELPVKFIVLKIKNQSGRACKLSATGFLEIVLGDVRSRTNMHIISEYDTETNTLAFRNRYHSAFADRVSFFRVDGSGVSFTADRSEFIGRNRNLLDPQSMHRQRLSGRSGACMDACAALQIKFELLDGAEKEIIFQVGSGENSRAVEALVRRFADTDSVLKSLLQVKEYWNTALEALQITTPDTALNILANGWLTYQTMSSRIFARSGFYQSGGAFGFRDQLQDVLSLLYTQPRLAREQILLNASRQFAEGDVQHWWHPPEGRGVRTRCSDDLLWLPFAVCRYVSVTGDRDILNVSVGFLESRALHPDEDSLYDLPGSGNLSGSLYEHCVRSIKQGLRFGKHGLPLIGSGDWNDGMDRVGHKGLGESVWLAFFLYDVVSAFAGLATGFGDTVFAEACKKEASMLQANIEVSGWDGQWYMRAYFDDDTPLGSKENDECRIDAIAQSWSVLSGAANRKRAELAMASLDKHLVKREMKLIQLLDPPFDVSALNPGYIKGYVPGVRENGGQYSHAAIWALMAFAVLGQREKLWELLSMVLPINHAADPDEVASYKVEPYVMAADVYANESHKGMGGWTWYTGSSGWMYQCIIRSLLGMELLAGRLKFSPCFPFDWPSVIVCYRFGGSRYKITVFQLRKGTGSHWKIDEKRGSGDIIDLVDDGQEHEVEMHILVPERSVETT